MEYDQIKYLPFGDRGVVVEFGDEISLEINKKVRSMYLAITQQNEPNSELRTPNLKGIISMNPTYRSLLIEYDPIIIGYSEIVSALKEIETKIQTMILPEPDIFIVPTLYGGEYGPDIATVMEKNNLSEEEVIAIHSGTDYLVYMFGFTPGFSYLGGMDKRLETPRLENPRIKIAGGSVGIAGSQTGIYSIDSPGGWQLIGHTPIKIYDPYRQKPILHKVGDYIRFRKIDKAEYESIAEKVARNVYEYEFGVRNSEFGIK